MFRVESPALKKSQFTNVKTMYVNCVSTYIYIHVINISYIISLFLFISLVKVFSIDLDLDPKVFIKDVNFEYSYLLF